MPGNHGVDALADQSRRADDGDRHAWVGARRALGELLDFHEVTDDAAIEVGVERGSLGERYWIVWFRPVHHPAGDEAHPADAPARPPGQHPPPPPTAAAPPALP